MVDAQLEVWQDHAEDQTGADEGVELEVADESAFLPEEPDLRGRDDGQDDDDDGEGGPRAGLLLQIVRCETLDGDEIEGVVRQSADPAAAEPEDGFFELCCQAG